jgi:hypothetical protein
MAPQPFVRFSLRLDEAGCLLDEDGVVEAGVLDGKRGNMDGTNGHEVAEAEEEEKLSSSESDESASFPPHRKT